jgi:fused signal recognition particle receptor
MLDFLKRNKTGSPDNTTNSSKGLFTRLKEGLFRTREVFSSGFSQLFLGKKVIDQALLEELEAFLLSADVGVESTQEIINDLSGRLKRCELEDSGALMKALSQDLTSLLLETQVSLEISSDVKPFVILMVGVNGTGKTTTIGKLAKKFQLEGKKVMLAAGDTFRAAAIEQLQVWGKRNEVPVIGQQMGSDSAAVIFDAFQAAKAREIDILIADTAGRLHTQDTLMEELKKIIRVIRKLDERAPHEILLVLDASIGQNALVQAKKFHEAIGVTGITLTKLDGTAKGGIIFNISKSLKIPIRFIGIGEGIEDLKPFEAPVFVEALFSTESTVEQGLDRNKKPPQNTLEKTDHE